MEPSTRVVRQANPLYFWCFVANALGLIGAELGPVHTARPLWHQKGIPSHHKGIPSHPLWHHKGIPSPPL